MWRSATQPAKRDGFRVLRKEHFAAVSPLGRRGITCDIVLWLHAMPS